MAGGYVLYEWNSVKKSFPKYQEAIAKLEQQVIGKCNVEWAPKTFSGSLGGGRR